MPMPDPYSLSPQCKRKSGSTRRPVRIIRLIYLQGFATGGKDGKVILWDPEFKKSIKTYELSNKFLAADSRGK
jgi:hypothetical protein